MKAYISILAAVAGIFLISFLIPQQKTQDNSIEGVWELKNQYLFEDNLVSDTIFNTERYRQVKMYSNNKVMWTRYSPKDSKEWFGYGGYAVNEGQLVETLEYASATMLKIMDTLRVFRFDVEIQKNSYSQFTLDEDGNRIQSENYVRVE